MSPISNTLPSAFGNPAQKMTSSEIAELVESRHDKVKQSIDRLVERRVISQPPLGEVKIQRERRVETTTVYVFTGEQGKRDSIIVVAQLCPEFTARLVDRWQELERAFTIDPRRALSDPAALRNLLLENVEKVIELQGEVEEMRPQVQALERIAMSEGSMCITDAAKTLQVQPRALFSYLREHHWIYRRPNSASDIAYQDKLQSGALEHKVTVVTKADGSEKTTTQVRITPKGLARLGKLFPPVAHAA
ncbi:phage antirepressor KilAC domain-containing protein [Novosphingobium clariflavum]|uniref:Phage antirepressor KilAC domain-containing protein n=1 Tax=Novosphingobium clariflavum TaxID=2029884 RepID=A0ABV6S6Q5_9SPHN|nr:phage antirepressor KilAC domain-containing protein [Novosphingobium clariflavum]